MTCDLCGTKDSVKPSYSSRSYCKKHFRELISKRIRKDLRSHKRLDISKKYHIKEEKPQDSFLKEMLQEIFSTRLELDEKGAALSTEILEEYSSRLFEEFLTQKEHDDIIAPLRRVSSEDLKLLGIPCKPQTHPLLAELEDEKAGSLFSLVKSLE